jgi:hypothetical protein
VLIRHDQAMTLDGDQPTDEQLKLDKALATVAARRESGLSVEDVIEFEKTALSAGEQIPIDDPAFLIATKDHHLFLSATMITNEGRAFTTQSDEAATFPDLYGALDMCSTANKMFDMPEYFLLEVVPAAEIAQEAIERARLLYASQVIYLASIGKIDLSTMAEDEVLPEHLLNYEE